jgi:hypothetical protein
VVDRKRFTVSLEAPVGRLVCHVIYREDLPGRYPEENPSQHDDPRLDRAQRLGRRPAFVGDRAWEYRWRILPNVPPSEEE